MRALHNLLEAMRERLAMQPGERMLSVTTATFDMSVPELFLPYYTGARAVIAPRATGQDPQALGDLIVRGKIGTAQATPTHWHMLATVCPEALRGLRILIGGEALSEKLAAALLDLGAEVVSAVRAHGDHRVVHGPPGHRTRGRRRRSARPCATPVCTSSTQDWRPSAGTPGRAVHRRSGLARGYLNRPELTAERFVPDRFGAGRAGCTARATWCGCARTATWSTSAVPTTRSSCAVSGSSSARSRPSLAAHPGVDQAAATVREDRPGDRRLVAYVTAAPGREPDAELRDFVADALPLYMVPSAVVALEEFPLTPNGKLDRKALPAPVVARTAMVETHLTQSELLLGRLFAEVLGVEQVGPRDSFFDLGGSSVLAARLLARVRSEMHLELSIRMLVESPTPAELSRRLTGEEPQDSFDVLLPLMTRGSARPLFCMRHLGGTAWCYGVLAQHFSLEYPLYGLQSHTFQEFDTPVDSVAAMAADYADRISGVQPTGPYRILGWSFGGILAHAVATEFQKRGEEIEFLGVFNTNPHITDKEDRDEQGLIELILLINGKDLAEYERPLRYDDVAEFADMATNYAWRGRKSAAETFVETMLTDLGAWKAHTPEKYSGAMHLFAADPSPVAEAASSEAWAPYVAGEIVRHELGCGHEEMLSSPRVLRQVAQIVTDHLRD